MPEISQAWLALIGAILGGSGLKFIEHYLSRPKIKDDSATAFRNELRQEMISLRTELRAAETDLDMWKAKYYDILEQLSKARIDRDEALYRIQDATNAALQSDHSKNEKLEIKDARDIASDELGKSD